MNRTMTLMPVAEEGLSPGSDNERMNETMKLGDQSVEMSFMMRVNSDDELEEHEKEGSPVVRISDSQIKFDDLTQEDSMTERTQEFDMSSPNKSMRSSTFVGKSGLNNEFSGLTQSNLQKIDM